LTDRPHPRTPERSVAPSPSAFSRAVRRSLPYADVRIRDAFWSPKLAVYRERTIPHSWRYVQKEIEDNEIAAGWRSETRGQDTPWNQANLHKVLETCAYALAQERDLDLENRLDRIHAAIAAAQQPDGYVNALITVRGMVPWANLDGQHDGYVAGHLIEAAVSHYLATGKSNFLQTARKLADHIRRRFIDEGNEGVCGHAELELALVRLYRVTGEPRYLDLAKDWIERRGDPWAYSSDTPRSYFMDHLPIRKVPEATGHAVRTMFYLTGVAGVATETEDDGLKAAARRLWRNVTLRKMYVDGSVGSQASDEGFGPAYDLPNRGYNESCAACGLLFFAHETFLMDGRSDSMDVLERTLYNAVLHGIALDGVSTYYRNPLSDENNPRYNVWVCCPPCLSRTLLRLHEFIYAQTDRDLYVNLYVGGEGTASFPNGRVTVVQETAYPWEGKIRLSFRLEQPTRFGLRLRIPGWSRDAAITVNGETVERPRMEKGYAILRREWRDGDVAELEFPMPAEAVEAHPRVKEDHGKVALQRGPLLYAFEALDNGGSVDLVLPSRLRCETAFRPDLLGGVVTMTGRDAGGEPFLAVPFYALANREPSQQEVWMRWDGKTEPTDGWSGKLYRFQDRVSPG
jgi:DUF1680 family protein